METVPRLTLMVYMLFLTVAGNRLANRKSQDDYLNICLDGQNHKSAPGPEADLMDKCKPWKNRSCCTKEVSELLHISKTWYNFDWNHCDQPLSDRCRARFIEDLCFYECSPNVGPWLVQVDMKVRNEKFMHVPLCETECNEWWDDCKDDFTCLKNWGRGFIWRNGTNECPKEAKCKSFRTVYDGAKDFCENVWDHSWKVVPDDDPAGCMVMWFDPIRENPNDAVAKLKVQMLLSGSENYSIFGGQLVLTLGRYSILITSPHVPVLNTTTANSTSPKNVLASVHIGSRTCRPLSLLAISSQETLTLASSGGVGIPKVSKTIIFIGACPIYLLCSSDECFCPSLGIPLQNLEYCNLQGIRELFSWSPIPLAGEVM